MFVQDVRRPLEANELNVCFKLTFVHSALPFWWGRMSPSINVCVSRCK